MVNITELGLKIKAAADELLSQWGTLAIIIVAVVASFGLGRLSVLTSAKPLVTVKNTASAASVAPLRMGGLIVASQTGKTYYYPWCAGAAKITPEKQRLFSSEAAAKRAGYRPAKNCKGLVGESQ